MKTELCRVTTDDGLQLDGVFLQPAPSTPKTPMAVDSFLIVHGTGSNFYAPGVLETFAKTALKDGVPVLRVNTRGHDGMASIPRISGSKKGGAAYETVSDCRYDLKAWISYMEPRGCERIGLVGHSMGGVKSLYFMAREGHSAVKRVIGLSPPRFCHEHWMGHPAANNFRDCYETAQLMVQDGRGKQLMSVRQPIPLIITAEGFLDKYGPDDNDDYVPLLPKIEQKTFILVGSQSMESPAFDTLPRELTRVADACENFTFETVAGADTMYSQCLDEPYQRVLRWLMGKDV